MSINELQKLQYGPGKGSGGRTDTDQSAMSGPAFGEMLKAKTLANQGLNFSKHAAKRMGERGIPMDYQSCLAIWNRRWRERDKRARRMWL